MSGTDSTRRGVVVVHTRKSWKFRDKFPTELFFLKGLVGALSLLTDIGGWRTEKIKGMR